MKYAVVQFPGEDRQEVIAWFSKREQALRYVAVNDDESCPLDVMQLDANNQLTTEF